jgi:hypothetical protein
MNSSVTLSDNAKLCAGVGIVGVLAAVGVWFVASKRTGERTEKELKKIEYQRKLDLDIAVRKYSASLSAHPMIAGLYVDKATLMFNKLDKNQNGLISKTELAEHYRHVLIDFAKETDAVLTDAGAESKHLNEQHTMEAVTKAFQRFDTNKDGNLDKAEFKTFVDTLLAHVYTPSA